MQWSHTSAPVRASSAFLVLPHVLLGTDRIATVPRAVAALLAAEHPLRVVDPPVRIPGFSLHQGWHEVHRHDAAHVWLRARVAEQARAIAGARS